MIKKILNSAILVAVSTGMLSGAETAVAQSLVYACVNNDSGTPKIIGPNETCNNNWTKVALGAGATGPAGPMGPAGPAGPAGPTGPTGLTGLTDLTGPVGPTGATGAVGPQGLVGPVGPKGDKGDKGVQGIQGEQGGTGIVNAYQVIGDSVEINAGFPSSMTVYCEMDGFATGGGWRLAGLDPDNYLVLHSRPIPPDGINSRGWRVRIQYIGTFQGTELTPIVQCIELGDLAPS